MGEADKTKERWVLALMKDYPLIDRMMAEAAVDMYLENPEYVEKLVSGEEKPPPPVERNTEFTYQGVSVDEKPETSSDVQVSELE